jgi:hypothetical protein
MALFDPDSAFSLGIQSCVHDTDVAIFSHVRWPDALVLMSKSNLGLLQRSLHHIYMTEVTSAVGSTLISQDDFVFLAPAKNSAYNPLPIFV